MMSNELPAKSTPKGTTRSLSLEQHLVDTEEAAALLFSADYRIGRNFRRFFQISEEDHPRFLLHVRIAGLLHDLGKANEGFVRAVSGERGAQVLRHEHLSALFLHLPEIRRWIGAATHVDWDVVTAAVLSHHLKADRSGEHQWAQPHGPSKSVALYLSHPEVERTLGRLAALVSLDPPPAMKRTHWRIDKEWNEILDKGVRAADEFFFDVDEDRARRSFLAAVKAGVIAADAVASGLFRLDYSLTQWLADICNQPAITDDDIWNHIITPRLDFISKRSETKPKLHPFQIEVGEQGSRVLLLAGCGMGKTLAAWVWAQAQTKTRAFGKVIFLYPTRGTATEGFRDYVGWAPETDATLLHGSARYELQQMLSNPSEATRDKNYETEDRLFALGLWSRKYFSATVDQFLGFLENQYSALCLLPALADSVVIIDEVHSFDPHMFDVLKSFLCEFDVPVLCMTATLPKARVDALVDDAKLSMFPSASQSDAVAALREKEALPRYQHRPLLDADAALEAALSAYRNGSRVLWVVNQVDRCQRLAARLSTILSQPVLCYHSRFRLEDRRKQHEATVLGFAFRSSGAAPAIAVTTQVCEMSLDLDADVLITEWAPVSALVQRFGRANRHLRRGPAFRATLHTYRPERNLPYDSAQIQAAEQFLQALAGDEISQQELAAKLLLHSPKEHTRGESARFLFGGYYAVPGQFRDADELSFSCVLDIDLPQVEAALRSRNPIDSFIVPVPKRSQGLVDLSPPFLPPHLKVASHRFYDQERGFLNESLS